MGVGSGSGNSISFSTIRDFYGDTNPVSLSEYNRSSNNSGLVDSTFVGSDTSTTGTSSQTVDDFAVTVTERDGNLVNLTTSGSNQANAPFPINASSGSFTLLNTTSFLNITIGGQGVATFAVNGSTIGSVNPNGDVRSFTIGGPQFTTGDRTLSVQDDGSTTLFSAGDVFTFGTSGAGSPPSTNTSTHGVRAVEFDITFQNNNSTGDTYTLTSSSTGASSKAVYGAGDSFLAQDNGSSNQFLLAYDNVIGSGPGTAGDINVTETSAFTGSPGNLLQRANSQNAGTLYTITADDALISLRGNDPSGASDQPASATFTITRSGSSVFSQSLSNFGDGAYAAYIKGPVYNGGSGLNLSISFPNFQSQTGDVITISSVQGNAGVSSQRRPQQFTTVFTNSSGSRSYTLLGGAGKSTGGAATLSPGATRSAQTTNSSGSSWAIFFDSTSGDCNVGIPTTIGVGNPVNMNLFNTVTTPLG